MDAEAKVNYLVDWLRQQVKEAGFSGAVLGIIRSYLWHYKIVGKT
jgi:NH3-dependent NAD+ synthetase